MAPEHLILLVLVALGVAARNALIVASASIVLVIHVLQLDRLFPILEKRGLQAGLIFLLIAVLVPFGTGQVGWPEIKASFTSWSGIAGIIGGMVAAILSGYGITLLRTQPEVIVGMVVGTVVGVVFFKGIPVGPLAAAGFTALLLALVK